MMTQSTKIVVSPVNIKSRQEIDIRPGDTVRVWQKVEEKGKTRLQPFEGVVIARKHGNEPGGTFTVRRVNDPYGVEKIFPLYSTMIDKIEITKRAKVRRAKLYHIREKAAKEIKRQMRNLRFVDIATTSDADRTQKQDKSGTGQTDDTEASTSDGTGTDEKTKDEKQETTDRELGSEKVEEKVKKE